MNTNKHFASKIHKVRIISQPLACFFRVELRNEQQGGVSPATLASAWDSWYQAPNDVKMGWCEIGGLGEIDLQEVEDELKALVLQRSTGKPTYLPHKLEDILADNAKARKNTKELPIQEVADLVATRLTNMDEGKDVATIFNESFAQDGEKLVYLGDNMFELRKE